MDDASLRDLIASCLKNEQFMQIVARIENALPPGLRREEGGVTEKTNDCDQFTADKTPSPQETINRNDNEEQFSFTVPSMPY